MYLIKHDKKIIQTENYTHLKRIYNSSFDNRLKIRTRNIGKNIKRGKYIPYIGYNNDNKVIGFSLVYPVNRETKHIDYFAIDREYRGKGIGIEFLNKLIEGIDGNIITLECEDKLISFYKKLDFNKTKVKCYGFHNLNFMIKYKYNKSDKSELDISNINIARNIKTKNIAQNISLFNINDYITEFYSKMMDTYINYIYVIGSQTIYIIARYKVLEIQLRDCLYDHSIKDLYNLFRIFIP